MSDPIILLSIKGEDGCRIIQTARIEKGYRKGNAVPEGRNSCREQNAIDVAGENMSVIESEALALGLPVLHSAGIQGNSTHERSDESQYARLFDCMDCMQMGTPPTKAHRKRCLTRAEEDTP
ncbi:hypothetical protein E4U55_008105 [Claviceps digitariae]|nr:hypothetical protein E4U55_008105 [Claviceps digitariae]